MTKYSKRLSILFALGIVLSLILVVHHVKVVGGYQVGPSICKVSELIDCDSVARSRYAELMGIPVAALGLWYYLVGTFLVWRMSDKSRGLGALELVRLVTTVSVLPTLAMAYYSISLGKLCIYCSLLYVLNLALPLVARWAKAEQSASPLSFVRSNIKFLLVLVIFSGSVSLILPLVVDGYYRQSKAKAVKFEAPAISSWRQEVGLELPINLTGSGLDRDFIRGDVDAPITLIEFSDFECPYCQRTSHVIEDLLERYKGKLRFVFRHYPLSSECNPYMENPMHKFACTAAKSMICAGLEGEQKYWEAHDSIFAREDLGQSGLPEFAREQGLDSESFADCMQSEALDRRLARDVNLGKSLGITGTPTIYINGKRVRNPSPDHLEAVIAYLAK